MEHGTWAPAKRVLKGAFYGVGLVLAVYLVALFAAITKHSDGAVSETVATQIGPLTLLESSRSLLADGASSAQLVAGNGMHLIAVAIPLSFAAAATFLGRHEGHPASQED